MTVVFMSLAAAVGTSTIYLLQPSVGMLADSLDVPIPDVGIALAGGPVGYLIGLATLVPLVDHYPPGRVLGGEFLVLAISLGATASVDNVAILGTLVTITGACSVVGAGMSSLTARLAKPHRRGTVLGIVTAGISGGILAGRIVGGMLASQVGWRAALCWFAGACFVLAVACPLVLPGNRARPTDGYLASIRSLPSLFAAYPGLRRAATRGALWFFGFCALWAGLAVALSAPPFEYSASRIGLYGLAGASGLAATQLGGRWADRVGTRAVVLSGLVISALAAAAAAATLSRPIGMLVCLAIFDAGLFAAQVANQSGVLALDPSAPALFNSAYMIVYFVGGSLGTAFGAAAIGWFGWVRTVLSICAVLLLAAGMTIREGATTRAPTT